MKHIKETSFSISPSVNLTVKVYLHPTLKSIRETYSLDKRLSGGVVAFCWSTPEMVKEDVIAELHFQKKDFDPGTIAHEALHAALELGRYLHLNLQSDDAEEILADAVDTIVTKVLDWKKSPASKQP